jgi:hypothetical protein
MLFKVTATSSLHKKQLIVNAPHPFKAIKIFNDWLLKQESEDYIRLQNYAYNIRKWAQTRET